MSEVEEVFEAEESPTVKELRASNNRLSRQLEKARVGRVEQVEAIYQAAKDALSSASFPSIKPPKPDNRVRGAEVACVGIGDWQLGKTTPNYDSDVCAERIERLANKVIQLTDIQRADHPVKECHVWGIGDHVEGELIFPGQAHKIDSGLYRQVCINGLQIMDRFLSRMLGHFDKVKFFGIPGNHGQPGGPARREYDPETNADRMLYRIVEHGFKCRGDKRIEFVIPDGPRERNWYAVDKIGDYSTLLVHGDQIRGWGGIPWYGANKKALGWKVGGIPDHFDDVISGHFHTPARVTINTVTYRFIGSPESYNTFAQEHLAAAGRPSQHLQFVHPKRRVSAEYTVWLDQD
jgi:hypothetical protein